MSTMKSIVLVLALLAALALSISFVALGDDGGSYNASTSQYEGAQAYATYCAFCHGADVGKGEIAPSNLAGKEVDHTIKFTRKGKGNMPAFGPEVIDDATLLALAEYIAGQDKADKNG